MNPSRRNFIWSAIAVAGMPNLAFAVQPAPDPWLRSLTDSQGARWMPSADVVRVNEQAIRLVLARLNDIAWLELSVDGARSMAEAALPFRDGVKPYLIRAIAYAGENGKRRGGAFGIIRRDGVVEVVFNTLGPDNPGLCHDAVIALLPVAPTDVYAAASMAE